MEKKKTTQQLLEALEQHSLHQKTFTLLRDFPELDSLLNCFIHRPQKERKKKKKTPNKPQMHPKIPNKPTLKIVWGLSHVLGFFPVHKQLNKKCQTNHHKSTGT